MAFAFFRKRQKMVIIIMVALMVSFLVTANGLNSLFNKDPRDQVVGTYRDGKITRGDVGDAELDLKLQGILQRTSLGYLGYRLAGINGQKENDVFLAYALLLHEAEDMGLAATDQDVENFFAQNGIVGKNWEGLLTVVLQEPGMTEKRFRQAIRNGLSIEKTYEAELVRTPPSEVQLRYLYRNLKEKLQLDIVKIPAEKFLDKVAEPTEGEINDQFNRYAMVRPESYESMGSFGFGYLQPPRVKISYLLINRSAVVRAVRPSEQVARDYYQKNEKQFVEDVEVPATPESDAQDANNPPVRREKVQRTFPEVESRIMDMLANDAANRLTQQLASRVQMLYQQMRESGQPAEKNIYRLIVEKMTLPADSVLDRPLGNLEINSMRLNEVVQQLVQRANLKHICFPYGKGKESLDPTVHVSLNGKMTLREALASIIKQVEWKSVDWAQCEGIDDVLFPVGNDIGLSYFPVSADQTAMVTLTEAQKDPLFTGSLTSLRGGHSLLQEAFTTAIRGNEAMLQIGDAGTPMVVWPDRDVLLWTLDEAEPARRPMAMTATIRRQVVNDLKTVAAFRLAQTEAAKLKQAALKGDLAKAAKDAGYEVARTKLFARYYIAPLPSGGSTMAPTVLPELPIPSQFSKELNTQLFALAPENPNTPVDKLSSAAEVIPLPPLHDVAVLLRVGYEPCIRSEYEAIRSGLAQRVIMNQSNKSLEIWMGLTHIERRMGFRLKNQ